MIDINVSDICENCYTLEFMRLKFHEVLEKSDLKQLVELRTLVFKNTILEIEIGAENPKNENKNKNDFGLFYW